MEDNVIKIGNKDFILYMRSIELCIRKQKKEKVILKARGLNIKKAVDLAEASKNKFLTDMNIKIEDIKISTSSFKDKENIERNVSCIDITLTI